MEEFEETQQDFNHKKKIQWSHIAICIIVLSVFFIILSIILNKDEQNFLFGNLMNFAKNKFENSITIFENPTQDTDNANSINSTPNIEKQESNPETPSESTVEDSDNETTPIEIDSSKGSEISKKLTDEQYEKIIHIYTQSPNKTVYLTFDDGPSPNVTPLILDELKKENVKATFFVLGMNVNYYPEIIKRAYSEGHYIANHGYSHKYSEIYENVDTVLNDYQKCEESLRNVLDKNDFSSGIYRFPGGSSGGFYDNIKQDAKAKFKEENVAYLDWNALTYDAENAHTKESILENLKNTVGDKNVVVLLMHDSSSKILTYETLPDIIQFFRDKGYTFSTLYEALQ